MGWRAPGLFLAALFLGVSLVWRAERVRAGHISCPEVLSAADRYAGQIHGRPSDLSELAKKLNTNVTWVEHCLRTYGRRVRRPGLESQEGRESRLEAFEEDEPEETGPEDTEEPGEREREERPERQRQVKVKPTPTFSLRDLER